MRGFLALLLWGSVLSPAVAREQDPSSFLSPEAISRAAAAPEWKRLLHYRAPFLRSERSDVDAKRFFLSPDGAHDPEAELRATLAVFLDPAQARLKPGPIAQAQFCEFPARKNYLDRVFGDAFSSRAKKVAAEAGIRCDDFEKWSEGIGAHGVSLVFSSAYPNNPASMFGHTFLRLDRDPNSHEKDLRSYGVNFAAQVGPDENPFKYALWGLIGGYTGRYGFAPYYQKVNEYAYSESRDLWEYRLSMTDAQVAQLVRHLWELYGQSEFDYYFLDENCSFQVLTALEAVRPDWDFSSGFILSAIPVDTVKHVVRVSGAVTSVDYRPSLRNQMVTALDTLTPEGRTRVKDAFQTGVLPPDLTASELDALIATLSYEKERGGMCAAKLEERATLRRTALLERSKRGKVDTSAVPTPWLEQPDRTHGSSRIFAEGGSASGKGTYGFGLYGFRHDLMDRTPSYNLFSEIRILGFRAESRERHGAQDLRFEEADLIGMASMAPYSIYDEQKSWRVGLGWSRVADIPESNAGEWKTEGGWGYGWNFFGRRNLIYAQAAGEFEVSGAFRHGIRFSPGGNFGVIFNPNVEHFFLTARVRPLWDATNAFPDERFRFLAEIEPVYSLAREWDLRFLARVQSLAGTELSNGREWEPLFRLQTNLRF